MVIAVAMSTTTTTGEINVAASEVATVVNNNAGDAAQYATRLNMRR